MNRYFCRSIILLEKPLTKFVYFLAILAVSLFGNVMSGAMIMGIILSIVPLFFPILFKALDLLTGVIQAYIFSILATVYIAAATSDDEQSPSATEPTV